MNQWLEKPIEELETNYESKEIKLEEMVNILNMQNKYIDLADRYIETANRVIRNLEEQIEMLHRRKEMMDNKEAYESLKKLFNSKNFENSGLEVFYDEKTDTLSMQRDGKEIETPPNVKFTTGGFLEYMASEGKKRKQKLAEEMQVDNGQREEDDS